MGESGKSNDRKKKTKKKGKKRDIRLCMRGYGGERQKK